MKRFVIVMLLVLCAIVIGCSKRYSKDTQKELSIEQKITEKAEEQKEELTGKIAVSAEAEDSKKKDIAESNVTSIENTPVEERKTDVSEFQLVTPDNYTQVHHNEHIYVYDGKGNSLNISIQSLNVKVDEYSEENYHQLISSTYTDVELQDLRHITIDELKTLYIEYTGKKNGKDMINCRYYIENGEYTIFIDLQAMDEMNCRILTATVDEIKF